MCCSRCLRALSLSGQFVVDERGERGAMRRRVRQFTRLARRGVKLIARFGRFADEAASAGVAAQPTCRAAAAGAAAQRNPATASVWLAGAHDGADHRTRGFRLLGDSGPRVGRQPALRSDGRVVHAGRPRAGAGGVAAGAAETRREAGARGAGFDDGWLRTARPPLLGPEPRGGARVGPMVCEPGERAADDGPGRGPGEARAEQPRADRARPRRRAGRADAARRHQAD